MTATQIAAARPPYLGGQSAGTRPGDPVWEPAPPARLTERERLERELGEIAAQLGVPAPDTVAGTLDLLVKAGLLTAHDIGGEVPEPPGGAPPPAPGRPSPPARAPGGAGRAGRITHATGPCAEPANRAPWGNRRRRRPPSLSRSTPTCT